MNTEVNPTLLDLHASMATPRLLLRPPQPGDGLKVHEAKLETYDRLRQQMAWAKAKPSIEEAEEYVRLAAANWILKLDEEPHLPIFMFDKNNQNFIGATGFHHIDWEVPCLEIGYWIREAYTGLGLMTEAVNALTRYAIDKLKMQRVEIRCDVNNHKSKKIPERLGYHLEATLKLNRRNADGALSDTLIYVKHNLDLLPDLIVRWAE
jgi:ribosomal-protein-serine acetyltransferase